MTTLTCTICPKGCLLTVDMARTPAVQGHACPRGAAFGRAEVSDPRRVLTTTVRLKSAHLARLPVKTSKPVPRRLIMALMAELNDVVVSAPVALGDVVLIPQADNEAVVVATRSVER